MIVFGGVSDDKTYTTRYGDLYEVPPDGLRDHEGVHDAEGNDSVTAQ
jgi:hypothetical protein